MDAVRQLPESQGGRKTGRFATVSIFSEKQRLLQEE
jgi:hypothetical protein